jgi:serine/threonine protein kinase
MTTNLHELSHRASRLVGTVLRDKWHLDALIGIGGMAAVYAATHRNGKRVAIKLLHPEMSLDPTTKGRFLREGYVANKVGHPGVVSVLDDDTAEDGSAYLVMDLLEGETLKARWRKSYMRLPVSEVLRITNALLDVLGAAHEKGIVHRDVKPDNVFLTNDGGVKVLDFGIARLRESSAAADATRSSAMLGTPAFMSPEQARSRWDWVDARTDLWAVGATMFTMLSGEFVHEAGTATEILVAAATQRSRPMRSVVPQVPESVAAVIDRALAFDPAERWQDARSMQAAVQAAMIDVAKEQAEEKAATAPTGVYQQSAFTAPASAPQSGAPQSGAPQSGGLQGGKGFGIPVVRTQPMSPNEKSDPRPPPSGEFYVSSPSYASAQQGRATAPSYPTGSSAGAPAPEARSAAPQPAPASAPQGFTAQGHAPQAPSSSQGFTAQALTPHGATAQAFAPQGVSPRGLASQPIPPQGAWPQAPQAPQALDLNGRSALMTTGAGMSSTQAAPTVRMKPRGNKLLIAGGIGALLIAALVGVFVLSPSGGASSSAGSETAASSAAPSAEAAPPAVSVTPAPESAAPSTSAVTQPSASASAEGTAAPRSGTRKPPRTTSPPATSKPKDGNPLDKY